MWFSEADRQVDPHNEFGPHYEHIEAEVKSVAVEADPGDPAAAAARR